MGLDTLTLLSRNEVKEVLWTSCGGKKKKWICFSATFLSLLVVVLTFSLALVRFGASTTYIYVYSCYGSNLDLASTYVF